jgi:diguanylate cyclase (GGDEF)-like protein
MSSLDYSLEQLRSVQRDVGLDAVALNIPMREIFQIACADGENEHRIGTILERVAESLALQCVGRPRPLIKNRVRETNGGPLLCRLLAVPVPDSDGEFNGILIAFRDSHRDAFSGDEAKRMSELAKLFAPASALAQDELTRLPTRAAFQERIAGLMHTTREPVRGALLYVDIDRLHVINELWGFPAGDLAIVTVAGKLGDGAARHNALASRLSGDRFAIFVPGCTPASGVSIARQFLDGVRAAGIDGPTGRIDLSLSIGVAAFDVETTPLDHALAFAETACKTASEGGGNRVELYEESSAQVVRRREDIVSMGRVRIALDDGRYRILAQPIASLQKADEVNRHEMLFRILDEKDRLIVPGNFMSAAERYRLLPEIDRCVVTAVLNQLAERSKLRGFEPLQVSINLSAPSLADPHFSDWLLAQIDGSGLPSAWIGFELSEGAAMHNLERAQALVGKLTERGCSFMLDDFGVGMSSLGYLQALNISMLKIDAIFVRDLLENRRSESVVRAIASASQSMGIATAAEHVESAQICMRLIDLGVQYGQGYAIGKPQPLERVLAGAPPLAQAS